MLIVQEPTFEGELDWLQFSCNSYQAGAYVVPASVVLSQSTIAEGEKLFPAILQHLRRLHPEVYRPAVSLVWLPARRDSHLGEYGAALSSVDLINNSFSNLCDYVGIFKNLSPITAMMNNPSPN